MTAETLKRTPLYAEHVRLGAKMVGFGGWELPVRYSGVAEEHRAVRERAGLFDICHMGEIFVSGPEAETALSYLTCNNVRAIYIGRAQYGAILNPRGGVVDDIIIYRLAAEEYLVCVNAANSDKDFAWLKKHNTFKAEFVNRSAEYGLIALQGPKACEIAGLFCPEAEADKLKYYHCRQVQLCGAPAIVARTGYTGEDGFEFFIPIAKTAELWAGLMECGARFGLAPVGLGARDSLRLEACYPLHGHELGEDISALESGLGWVVKFEKGDFIGREALLKQKQAGVPRVLVGFLVDDPGVVREGTELFSQDGSAAGYVTSGTLTPTLNQALGLALIKSEYAPSGTKLQALVRGKRLAVHVAQRPFYRR
jgi:aminomethyltransferase